MLKTALPVPQPRIEMVEPIPAQCHCQPHIEGAVSFPHPHDEEWPLSELHELSKTSEHPLKTAGQRSKPHSKSGETLPEITRSPLSLQQDLHAHDMPSDTSATMVVTTSTIQTELASPPFSNQHDPRKCDHRPPSATSYHGLTSAASAPGSGGDTIYQRLN
jgi:hypothetical protein